MKKVFILMMVVAALFAVFAIGAEATDANITWVTPSANGATISGIYALNVSNNPTTTNVSNVSFYYTPAGGALTLIGINTTANASEYGFALDTTALDDSVLYTLTARALNASNGAIVETETRTGIIIDNGNPTCSVTAPLSSTHNEFDVALTAAMDETVSCTFTINNKVFTGSLASDVCSYTLTQFDGVPDGIYTITATATDASSDVTSCTSTSVEVYGRNNVNANTAVILGAAENAAAAQSDAQKSSTTQKVVGIVLIIGVLWYFSGKGKGK